MSDSIKVIGKYLFQGGDTNGLPIEKDWCIQLLCSYLKTRKDYDWILKDYTLFVTDKSHNHIVTLRWHKYGFDLEDDFQELSGKGLEVVLISINAVFRSICRVFWEFSEIMEDEFRFEEERQQENKEENQEDSDEDYWI